MFRSLRRTQIGQIGDFTVRVANLIDAATGFNQHYPTVSAGMLRWLLLLLMLMTIDAQTRSVNHFKDCETSGWLSLIVVVVTAAD